MRLFDEMVRDMWDYWPRFNLNFDLIPHTDIYEEKGELVMKTELPGINKEDLDITLDGDILTVKAEKKDEEVADRTHHTRERSYGSYQRSMRLPYPVNKDKIAASFDNGVLELRLPKAEAAEAKKIEVKAQLAEVKAKPRKRRRKKTAEK